MVCYNFMPVFDWTRSELARKRADGSTVLAYNQDIIDQIDPEHMRESIEAMSAGYVMPGWEPAHIEKLLRAVDRPYNGLTLCTGSLGSNQKNDIPGIIEAAKGRIAFAHVRNLKYNSERDFEEAAHLSSDGSMDMYRIMKTLYDTGFDGVIRPDHGRAIWGEEAMPGYGLYDRALGAMYLQGLWEAIRKNG